MFKNVASQKLTVFAFADAGHASLDAGEPVTGDAANITMKVEQDDDGTQSASNDTNPTEVEDGQYRFDLTQAETNGDKLTFYPESSTAGVQVIALPSSVIYTRPANFTALGIESDGDLTKVNTLDGHTAQTGDSFARLGAPAGASVSADIATVDGNVDTLLTRITSTLFSGITSLAEWLGLIAGKQTGDATARTEIRATGAGSGTYDETTDSQEALRDHVGDGTNLTEAGGTGDQFTAFVSGSGVNVTQFGGSNGTFNSGIPDVRMGNGITHGGTTAMLRLGASGTTAPLLITNSGNGAVVGINSTGATGKALSMTANSSQRVVEVIQTGSGPVVLLTTSGAGDVVSFKGVTAINNDGDFTGDLTGTLSTCTANTDMRGTDNASTHTAANVRTEMDSNSTQLAAIVADTNELQGDWANGGRLDLILDELTAQGDTNEAAIGALNDVSVSDILTTQMTESYATNGTAPTLAQAMFAVHQMLMQFGISGTTYTVKQLDNSSTAFVVTLDDGTNPTSAVRT